MIDCMKKDLFIWSNDLFQAFINKNSSLQTNQSINSTSSLSNPSILFLKRHKIRGHSKRYRPKRIRRQQLPRLNTPGPQRQGPIRITIQSIMSREVHEYVDLKTVIALTYDIEQHRGILLIDLVF